MLVGQACQTFNSVLIEVIKDIYVSLENDDVRTKFCGVLVVVTLQHR